VTYSSVWRWLWHWIDELSRMHQYHNSWDDQKIWWTLLCVKQNEIWEYWNQKFDGFPGVLPKDCQI
jgi:hypothetical protein